MTFLRTTSETREPAQGIPTVQKGVDFDRGPELASQQRSARPLDSESRRTYEQLTKAVRRACPPWLGDRVDDLAQKAALRVLERTRRAGEASQLNVSYLYRVASSVVIDEIRSLRRREHVQMAMPERDAVAHGSPAHDEDPERSAARQRLGSQILGCLQQMNPDRRSAMTLCLQGYSVAESAELLGWNRKRTENLTCRARADLRSWLAAKGVMP